MAFVSRYCPTVVLSTTVDCASQDHRDEVQHTTRLSNLGITLFRSQETIVLGDDGYSFGMTGTQAFFPRLWVATAWAAQGKVDLDHDGAVYHIPWLGVMIQQTTHVTPRGLEVIQTTPFSRTTILLRRQSPRKISPRSGPA